MISEANHYTTFIGFARQIGDPDKVNKRWEEWLEYEAQIINLTVTKKQSTANDLVTNN
jgi:tRNA isopentenyl-2-thiomethyl-A-37 hydroxylase MiaE